ncbi:MAG TPA: type I restriction-modification system subunit M N-terminal domain-containing protein [Myxococcaceae bacterium]|nr:type I restriction-modification system subunit M N-terminal domain-containing protein [Myxococcaceae bacterium]
MRAGHPQLRDLEREFWAEIDALVPGIDRGEFRRRVLGLVFLRYLDASFEDRRTWLGRESRDARSVYFSLDEERHQILGRPDAYHAAGVAFIVPAARWDRLHRMADSPEPGNLGRAIDAMLISVVKRNPRLEGVFPEDYSRPELSRSALCRAVLAISAISVPSSTPQPVPQLFSSEDIRTTADVLAYVCQGFLAEAAAAAPGPGPNRLRIHTPLPAIAPEYSGVIASLDRQLQELARILGRRPRLPGTPDSGSDE